MKCLLYKSPAEFTKAWYNGKIGVVYDIKKRKQQFFFRKQQVENQPAYFPEDICVFPSIKVISNSIFVNQHTN